MSFWPLSDYDLQKTCRSCLRVSDELIPLDSYPKQLPDDESDMNRSMTTGELMMACANIKIALDDGLPRNVCSKCVSDVNAAFAYKAMCEKSDAKLRSMLPIKSGNGGGEIEINQESKAVSVDYSFEANCFALLDAEAPKDDSTLSTVSEEAIEGGSNIIEAIDDVAFPFPSMHDDSSDSDILDMWDEMLRNECKVDENETANKQSAQIGPKGKKEKNFLCEYCSGTFYSIGQLTTHYVTHTGRKDFVCDICKRQYSTKACLKDHMRYHGEKSKLYCHLCSSCGRGFAYRKSLAEHMHVHSGERPYKCDICPKTYHTRQNLRVHKKKHNPVKPCVCKTCGKGFVKNSKLIIHVRTHTGERPYDCKFCDRKFSQNSTLRAHMRVHTGEKHYCCNVCDERFIQNYQLVGHRQRSGHWLPGTEPILKAGKDEAKGKRPKANTELVPEIEPYQPW